MTTTRAALTIAEACKELGEISIPTLNRLVRRGHLKITKIGRRTVIRAADLEACLDRLQGLDKAA